MKQRPDLCPMDSFAKRAEHLDGSAAHHTFDFTPEVTSVTVSTAPRGFWEAQKRMWPAGSVSGQRKRGSADFWKKAEAQRIAGVSKN